MTVTSRAVTLNVVNVSHALISVRVLFSMALLRGGARQRVGPAQQPREVYGHGDLPSRTAG
jgi:hypothetical protein